MEKWYIYRSMNGWFFMVNVGKYIIHGWYGTYLYININTLLVDLFYPPHFSSAVSKFQKKLHPSKIQSQPVVCRTPFGLPVLPEVYNMKRGSSLSIHSQSQVSGWSETKSEYQTSRWSTHMYLEEKLREGFGGGGWTWLKIFFGGKERRETLEIIHEWSLWLGSGIKQQKTFSRNCQLCSLIANQYS